MQGSHNYGCFRYAASRSQPSAVGRNRRGRTIDDCCEYCFVFFAKVDRAQRGARIADPLNLQSAFVSLLLPIIIRQHPAIDAATPPREPKPSWQRFEIRRNQPQCAAARNDRSFLLTDKIAASHLRVSGNFQIWPSALCLPQFSRLSPACVVEHAGIVPRGHVKRQRINGHHLEPTS